MRSLLIAAAVALAAAQNCAPQQFWVNYGDAPTDMVVSWTTSATDASTVNYGNTPTLGQSTSGPAPATYTFQSYTSPFIHHVVLSNLPLNSTVYYSVGGSACGFSPVMAFKTHPSTALQSLTFAVIGDLGQTSNSNDTINHILAGDDITAVIHVGDLSYADEDEPRWDSWQQLTSPLSSIRPWMLTPGNHEVESATGIPDFLAYSSRFRMPYVNGQPSFWYSFETGPVHWIMLNSYSDFTSSSPQYAWLEKDLASIDRTATPWVFVGLHAPWFNSNTAHHLDGEAMRIAMEPMLYAAGVDLVLAGHVHAYERNHRVYNYNRDPKGPTYITIGDGGNREGLATQWMDPQPAWSNLRKALYGHGQLQVVNATHVHWTWHANPDAEPTVEDDFWLIKGQDN